MKPPDHKMKPVRLLPFLTLLLFSCLLAGAADASTNAVQSLKRLVLHDFNRAELDNNLRGSSGTWNLDESDAKAECNAIVDSTHKVGDSGNSLFLSYKLNPVQSEKTGLWSQNGFWTNLNKLDATDYDHFEFWVKGDPKLGFAKSFKIEFKKPKPNSPGEMDKASYVVNNVTDQWQKVTVPLNVMNGLFHWDNPENTWKEIEEMVISFHTRRADVKQGAYYFDDFALIKTGDRGPDIRDPVAAPKKKQWEKERGGEKAAIPEIQKRLVGWPKAALADKSAFPKDDREFLMRVAKDTWKGIDALTDKEHGLPLDTVRFSKGSVELKDSRIGDYTNVTNIGIYFLSVVAACDLKLITREEAVEKIKATLASVEKMESHEGFLYNYYDTTSRERTSNFVSFVDSAWLTSGLMVVRNAFPEFAEQCTKLIDRGNYKLFYDEVEQQMNHGTYVHMNARAEYNYGALYSEPRAGSLIAIGKGDVPESHWFSLMRTFPTDYDWQSMIPKERKVKKVRDHIVIGGYYEWKGMKYIPCWGGSLFEALMPTMVIDEAKLAPNSLGKNNEVHATIHRLFATEELKYPVWGMSPSSMPSVDNYSEYGVKILGTKGYKPGVVTPHVVGLAVNVTPKEATDNLRKLIEKYDIYGEYGFYDAVDPVSGQVAYKYLVLDQGMLFVGLANHLGDGCVQKHFMSDPIAKKALPIIQEEHFFQ
jgi:hypothetical protein